MTMLKAPASEMIVEILYPTSNRTTTTHNAQTEKLNKSAPRKNTWYQRKGSNGGARPGAGRPPGGISLQRRIIKQIIEDYALEEIYVETPDLITGKIKVEKKSRLTAAFEKLFIIGMTGDGDANALDKWLNRAIGKPVQPIEGEDNEPLQIDLGIERILEKVYGQQHIALKVKNE